ncbi:hypothetical protein Hdeb2414_s0006g00193331 [Helianthus debilis subsp. tardiflorus]
MPLGNLVIHCSIMLHFCDMPAPQRTRSTSLGDFRMVNQVFIKIQGCFRDISMINSHNFRKCKIKATRTLCLKWCPFSLKTLKSFFKL